MTTMFEPFVGVPQSAIRSGKMRGLSGAAIVLYLALCHESERYSTREITRTVAELQALVGRCPNTLAKARVELVHAGLVQAAPFGPEGYTFLLCDPETGRPWPLAPREPFKLPRKNARPTDAPAGVTSTTHPRRPTKMEIAGTSFPYGANAPEQPGEVRKPVESAPQQPSTASRWEGTDSIW
jgi:hypothetical protein